MRHFASGICLVIAVIIYFSDGYAQRRQPRVKERKLIAFVCTEDGEAISGVVLCSKGKGVPSEPTDGSGRTLIDLTGESEPGEPIDLMLVQGVPANRDWEIPPGIRLLIHTFRNKPNEFTTVILRNKAVRREIERLVLQSKEDSEATRDLQSKRSEMVAADIQRGHYHFSYSRYSDALDAYKKALENSPNNDDIFYSVALTLAKLDRNEDALSVIEKCLAIRKAMPESLVLADTYESYAVLLSRVNRKDKVEEQLVLARAIRERLSQRSSKQ
jgi:hypothetical protein